MITKTRLAVPDVTCSHCVRAITDALTPLAGVSGVAVDVRGRVVAVEHNPQVAPARQIARAIQG